jgi:fructosamine-3-kinase/protein-tyrosine-phosphatase
MPHAVLFVCLGNICRSPLAEAAFRLEAERRGLDVEIDSAGTGDWHAGEAPDPRAVAVAAAHGADISHLRARQVRPGDFDRYDSIVALDRENLAALRAMRPPRARARLSLLLDHVPGREGEPVADPYYGGAEHFEVTWRDVSEGAEGFARMLARAREAPDPSAPSAFAEKVAAVTGVAPERLARLAGDSLSEVLRVPRHDGLVVAKSSQAVGTEAAMLRAIADAGVPAPCVEGEHDGVLLLEHIDHDGQFSPRAWRDIGVQLRRLHARTGETYGWPADYALGTVAMDNREGRDWPNFWGEQRLAATAALLDRPWRERVDRLTVRLPDLLPAEPPAGLLHGDCWAGNILVRDGRLVGLIDPACYHGDPEVDLAMLDLFCSPPEAFREGYGPLPAGWRERQPVYQLFPALAHVRLWGPSYYRMVDRLLAAAGV